MPDPYWIGAQVCAVVANANRVKGRALKAEDFIPHVVVRDRRQTPEEIFAAFRAATDTLGGK